MKVVMPGLLTLFVGCASGPLLVDGVQMNRVSNTFVGQPFHVTHSGAHPRPGSPSGGLSADGGEIAGSVCGVSVNLGVRHEKDRVEVACGEGRIAILRAQLEGKKPLDAKDLVTGRALTRGSKLGGAAPEPRRLGDA